jgi:hypothetical protein
MDLQTRVLSNYKLLRLISSNTVILKNIMFYANTIYSICNTIQYTEDLYEFMTHQKRET